MQPAEILERLFINRQDAYGEQQPTGTYTKISSPVNEKLIDMHLGGYTTIGTYLINEENNTTKTLCFDIDDHDKTGRDCTGIIKKLVQFLKEKYGLTAYIEASGSENSYHIWLFLNLTPAGNVLAFGEQVIKELNLSEIEVFPKQPRIDKDGYGNLVKLPLGINKKSGKRSHFLNLDTMQPLSFDNAVLMLSKVEPCTLPNTQNISQEINQTHHDNSLEVEHIMPKLRPCMQKVYVEKWQLSGAEGHDLRLAIAREMLFYGADDDAIHTIFSCQQDYDHEITQKHIDSLKQNRKPLKCNTLRSKSGSFVKALCQDCNYPEQFKKSKQGGGEKNNKATELIKIVEDSRCVLFCDSNGNVPFVRVPVTLSVEVVLPLGSLDFKRWLSQQYYQKFDCAVKKDDIANALLVLEARASYDGKKHDLYNRVAKYEDSIYYDLVNESWQAVRITPDGWEVVQQPILFRRYAHQKQQVKPEQGGDIKKVFKYVNLKTEDHQMLFLVYLVSCFIPDFPHTILILYGAQGAAKSSTFKVVKKLADPSSSELSSFPKDNTELAQKLSHNWIVFFDNVGVLSAQQSDSLCRASTGEGFSKRQLFTDDEDFVYSFKRCVGLNGINVVASKPDLLDRSIILELERIPRKERKPESEIWGNFDRDKAAILGGIFDVLSKTMAIRPTIKLSELPRMADFALWGYAIAEALGYSGDKFINVYSQNIERQNKEALKASIIGDLILDFMEGKDKWEGTAGDLIRELEMLAEAQRVNTQSKTWPKSPNTLSRRINELKTNLLDEGISISNDREGRKRIIILERLHKNDGKDDGMTIHDDTKNCGIVTNKSIAIDSNFRQCDDNDDIFPTSGLQEKKEDIEGEQEREYKGSENTVNTVISSSTVSGDSKKNDDMEKQYRHKSSLVSSSEQQTLAKIPAQQDRLISLQKLWEQVENQPVPKDVLIKWHSFGCKIPEDIAKSDVDHFMLDKRIPLPAFAEQQKTSTQPHQSYLCEHGQHKDCGGFACFCSCHQGDRL